MVAVVLWQHLVVQAGFGIQLDNHFVGVTNMVGGFMKPTGLGMTVTENGIGFALRRPSNVEDAVWEAVEMALEAGWSPERMRSEVADAWREKLQDEAKHAVEVLSR